ncbi:MAG: hypothetical protein AAF202_07885, partial [Pseudomonadota bacterium]
ISPRSAKPTARAGVLVTIATAPGKSPSSTPICIAAINSDEGRNETAIAEIARRLNTDLDMIHALLMQARDVADEVRAEHNPEGKQVIPVRPSQFVSKYSDLDEPVQNFVKNYAALRGIVLESKARSLAIDALKGAGGILRDAIFQDR